MTEPSKYAHISIEDVQAAVKAAIEPLETSVREIGTDLLRLAQAVHQMNQYTNRLPEVEEVTKAILAPRPEMAKANESLAEIRASKQRLEEIFAVTIDWDDNWNFLFQARGKNGYATTEGFSLLPDHPGQKALEEAIDVLGIPIAKADLSAPKSAPAGKLERRIIYQRGEDKK